MGRCKVLVFDGRHGARRPQHVREGAARQAGLPAGPGDERRSEANSFVDSLTRSLAQAAIGCQNRLPVRPGTNRRSICRVERHAPAMAAARFGRRSPQQDNVTIAATAPDAGTSPASGGRRNILNWACATGSDSGDLGNPTVSLSGQIRTARGRPAARSTCRFKCAKSGQIIVRPESCGIATLLTTGDITDVDAHDPGLDLRTGGRPRRDERRDPGTSLRVIQCHPSRGRREAGHPAPSRTVLPARQLLRRMADAADARHEDHAHRAEQRHHLRVVAGAARQPRRARGRARRPARSIARCTSGVAVAGRRRAHRLRELDRRAAC